MKKMLAVIAIAGALVACNDSSDSSTTTDSATMNTTDTTTITTDTNTTNIGVDTSLNRRTDTGSRRDSVR